MNLAAELFETRRATEIRERDDEGALDDFSTDLADQLHRRLGRPASRDQIIHQENPLSRLDRAQMKFDPIRPVLEIEILADLLSRQLSGFSHWDEPETELISDGGAEDEPARLDSDDDVDAPRPVSIGNSINGQA